MQLDYLLPISVNNYWFALVLIDFHTISSYSYCSLWTCLRETWAFSCNLFSFLPQSWITLRQNSHCLFANKLQSTQPSWYQLNSSALHHTGQVWYTKPSEERITSSCLVQKGKMKQIIATLLVISVMKVFACAKLWLNTWLA